MWDDEESSVIFSSMIRHSTKRLKGVLFFRPTRVP